MVEVVRAVLAERLAPARLDRVDVEKDIDHDGDPILRIKIVFDVDGERLDPKAVRGLARHLRTPLAEFTVEDFPVFTYRTVEEDRADAA